MVIENLIKERWIERRAFYSFVMGVGFTLIAFLTSYALFKDFKGFVGIATIFFTVILGLPSVSRLFRHEEKRDVHLHYIGHKSKEFLISGVILVALFVLSIYVIQNKAFFLLLHIFGIAYIILYLIKFFKRHHGTIDFFVYFFIGSFLVFFFMSMYDPGMVYSLKHLSAAGKAPLGMATGAFDIFSDNTMRKIVGVFENNFYVMMIAFLLSLFYGSGALFLITLNGSIFASVLSSVIRTKMPQASANAFTFTSCNLGIMFFHMIPEVGAYFLGAIAGGILSKAFIKEKIMSRRFLLVSVDAIILFLTSLIVLVVAATIEMDLSKHLFSSNVCNQSANIVNFILLILFGCFIAFEFYRIRLKKDLHERAKKIVDVGEEDHRINAYVKMCVEKGYPEKSIMKYLLKKGVDQREIENALHRFRKVK